MKLLRSLRRRKKAPAPVPNPMSIRHLPHFCELAPEQGDGAEMRNIRRACGCPRDEPIEQRCDCRTWSCAAGHEWYFQVDRTYFDGFVLCGTTVRSHDPICELHQSSCSDSGSSCTDDSMISYYK